MLLWGRKTDSQSRCTDWGSLLREQGGPCNKVTGRSVRPDDGQAAEMNPASETVAPFSPGSLETGSCSTPEQKSAVAAAREISAEEIDRPETPDAIRTPGIVNHESAAVDRMNRALLGCRVESQAGNHSPSLAGEETFRRDARFARQNAPFQTESGPVQTLSDRPRPAGFLKLARGQAQTKVFWLRPDCVAESARSRAPRTEIAERKERGTGAAEVASVRSVESTHHSHRSAQYQTSRPPASEPEVNAE